MSSICICTLSISERLPVKSCQIPSANMLRLPLLLGEMTYPAGKVIDLLTFIYMQTLLFRKSLLWMA
uniref:Uncharacterized protein n=1 Tax=Utricularia reniformis TaxID=192314 RepID=A0A1Y0B378_9LAMI|nr:hypothetical protein AEK19_MT1614 [Utricularia reniformis]ART31799.1 hypothetical protein AEK19_MT1614 [Utricularia reniformis]